MNWNWPAEVSVAIPSVIQLVEGKDTLVVANTVKFSPALSMKSNCKLPADRIVGLFNLIVVADQRLRPGKIDMDEGEFNPDAKTEPMPSGVNFSMVPVPEFAT